jgi:hypothetical protein
MLLLIPFFAFSLMTRARAAMEKDSCEFFARKLGQPVDGWKLRDETRTPNCIREVADLRCNGQQFYNPVSPSSNHAE